MKIAVSSTGTIIDSAVEPRFGRCPYFLIVNPATLEFEALANANAELVGGAGIIVVGGASCRAPTGYGGFVRTARQPCRFAVRTRKLTCCTIRPG